MATHHRLGRTATLTAALALTLTGIGCQGVNTSQRAEPRAQANIVDDHRVTYDGTLNLRAQIVQLNEGEVNGFLKVQAEVLNRTLDRQRVSYRFDWIDSQGMQITTSLSNWKALSLASKESRLISAQAPTRDAVDFRLSIVEPKGTW